MAIDATPRAQPRMGSSRWRLGRWITNLGIALVANAACAVNSSAEIARVLADPAAYSASVESGKRLATFCFNCHGEDGHSKTPETPNIAGQNAVYVLEQIRKFAAGERKNEFMQGLTRALSEQERINVAVYFSAQKALPSATGGGGPQAARGEAIYRKTCVACHGEKGHGKDEIPRIAGQHGIYLNKSLTAYRSRSGVRGDPRMTAIAVTLSDQDIAALADYLSVQP